MRPELVCKIIVRTPDGEDVWRGSGYPITPNRIITAAHVVADAAYLEDPAHAGAARHITLTFGSQAKPIDTPVSVTWSGTAAGVDVAILSCQLPLTLQPAHELLTMPPKTSTKWQAQGYTNFAKDKRTGGQDAYGGTMYPFSAQNAQVVLSCTEGLVAKKQWKGASGSMVFDDCNTSQTALAVITGYQPGKKLDQLKAVPLCYLLNNKTTRDDFRRAIQFEAYGRRRDYRKKVLKVVATKLRALDAKVLVQVVEELNALLAPRGLPKINGKLSKEARVQATAVAMVSHVAVTDVVARLVGLMHALGADMRKPMAEIIDYIFPLNYAPGIMRRLQDQCATAPLGLIENEVATRALAEIIMASYDQQPAKFGSLTDDRMDVLGKTALDYREGPEGGPDVLRAAYNFLYDLVARQNTLLGDSPRPLPRTPERLWNEAELVQKIQEHAESLCGFLKAMSSIHDRTVYCVLSPLESTLERDFRKRMLHVVHEHLQPHGEQLIFVELMKKLPDKRENEIRTYITARVLWTQP